MEFPRQEYWSGWPFPSPGDLPDPGIELWSLALQADSFPSESPKWKWKFLSRVQFFGTPWNIYSPWNSPGQNTGVGSHSLLQGSSQPRDWTQASPIASGCFTSWATGEAVNKHKSGSVIIRAGAVAESPLFCVSFTLAVDFSKRGVKLNGDGHACLLPDRLSHLSKPILQQQVPSGRGRRVQMAAWMHHRTGLPL